MRKVWIGLLSFIICLSAQDENQAPPAGEDAPPVEPPKDNPATGATSWEEFVIDDFEDAGLWQGDMARDQGIIRVMRRDGAPLSLTKKDPDTHKYVLGGKISFFRSGRAMFAMSPPREVPIPGIAKKLSIWVAGRSFTHELKGLIRDFMGTLHVVSFGQLNFPGWNQLESQIGVNVIQDNYRLFSQDNPRGIKLKSIVVECSMNETFGQYFIYLDDLVALTDVFLEREVGKDKDNMMDDW